MAAQMTVQVIATTEKEGLELYEQLSNNSKSINCSVEIGENQFQLDIREGTILHSEIESQIIELERARLQKGVDDFNTKHPPTP